MRDRFCICFGDQADRIYQQIKYGYKRKMDGGQGYSTKEMEKSCAERGKKNKGTYLVNKSTSSVLDMLVLRSFESRCGGCSQDR